MTPKCRVLHVNKFNLLAVQTAKYAAQSNSTQIPTPLPVPVSSDQQGNQLVAPSTPSRHHGKYMLYNPRANTDRPRHLPKQPPPLCDVPDLFVFDGRISLSCQREDGQRRQPRNENEFMYLIALPGESWRWPVLLCVVRRAGRGLVSWVSWLGILSCNSNRRTETQVRHSAHRSLDLRCTCSSSMSSPCLASYLASVSKFSPLRILCRHLNKFGT